MKVVLTKDVPNLGVAGEVKEVKKGYCFNYLLPEGLAELATPGVLKSVARSVAQREAVRQAKRTALSATLKNLDGLTLTIRAKAEAGKLFGSVGASDIVAAAKESDIEILEEMVALDRPIRSVGEHVVTLRGGESKAVVTISVVAV